uniref:Protein kinase domain-containing protein n=1 Tax=Brassica oleracea TaxID=3712 RepID=A0A3P6DJ81_BRAOL|nr:unnamed protein product [Brassica oleracea]
MKKFFCCHKGESSSGAVEAEEQTQPLQPVQLQPSSSQPVQDPQASSRSVKDENEAIFDENLFDNNEGLNLAWRNLWKSYEDAKASTHDPYPGPKIKWSEIFQGTLNFRNINYLGRGNFGEVYRCDIPRLDKVGAAKVQKNQSEEAHHEFLAEITTLHAANHPNVISLLGKCFHQDHRVIVYEFMHRGSLDHHLFPNTRLLRGRGRGLLQEYKVLSWTMRLRIAVGVAKALVYLHEELKMVHRDVKVSNVLLDKKFVPKLTDFGLASCIVEDENGVEKRSEITLIKGTPGCTAPETEELETPRLSPPRLPYFTLRWEEILDGTQNLLDTNLLGEGNFGQVYRCNLPRLNQVGAAKIQKVENEEAKTEFEAEITTLHRANHPNVINLLGQCVTDEDRVIVYQFMPRGSLDHHLYADTRPGPGLQQQGRAVLNWERRMSIALGVAEALIYLHEDLKTVHRDLKVANVLLDEDFVPKLTDFGLATRMVHDANGIEKQSEIDPIKGTRGCIAPETEESGLVSSKSDVYSYGVFLLTLFTGRKAFDRARPIGARKINEWLMSVWRREEYLAIVLDVSLGNTFSAEGLNRLFQAARMCMDPNVLARPTMRFVETMVRQAAAYDVVTLPPVLRRDLV